MLDSSIIYPASPNRLTFPQSRRLPLHSAPRKSQFPVVAARSALPCADSKAGRGLLTRSGNAAFRRQPPQTAQAGRGLLTAPTPGPTTSRSDVAEVAKGGGVDGCIPATAGGNQISHSETFANSLSLNDPPNIDRPSINRNLQSAIEVPRHQHLATKISQLEVS
jgi:hypothetical protein